MEINPAQLGRVKPLKPMAQSAEEQLQGARDLKKAYTDFVGKTFFGQMMKAMRSTVDKPAYFHGGQAEEMFRSQLDQQMADSMSAASAQQISEPMFARQFPRQAQLLADAEEKTQRTMTDLTMLRRR
ncbi:MAG TPA: rod-binding protein [Lacipirellulaceae bacterium]|nr:rod-binding protein [Lacipirellulaceae bacterium]